MTAPDPAALEAAREILTDMHHEGWGNSHLRDAIAHALTAYRRAALLEAAGEEVWSHDVLKALTRAVRAADREFEKAGGNSRHWARDHFWPNLVREGLALVPTDRLRAMAGGE